MPQNDAVSKILSSAKSELGKANTMAASLPKAPSAPAPKPAVKPAAPAPSIGRELDAKNANVKQYMDSLPKMHDGGPVVADGPYQLKAGEHVLTEPQAKMARKHALMSIGMKRLSKPAQTAGEPTKVDAEHKKPEKKVATGIKVRPEPKKTAVPHGRGEK